MMRGLPVVALFLVGTASHAEWGTLSVHDIGEYAAVPWGEPGAEIQPGTRADRVRDLNLGVSSINLQGSDDVPADLIAAWAEKAKWGRQQGKKLLPRVYFWDGADRYQGDMRDIAIYWNRLDQFLGGVDLADFHGIILAEENVHYSGRPEVLTELYNRIKAKYDVQVWQWWSPMTAIPGSGGWIPSDGWVIDTYFKPYKQFRRFARKYTITGLPLVVMPWADDSRDLTPVQSQANNAQLDVAMEFGVPVAFYWVKGTTCYFDGSRDTHETKMDHVNHWVWDYIERARALPDDYVGLPTADKAAGDVLEIGPTDGDDLVYVDDFSTSTCVDDASATGFRDLVLDGQTLRARGLGGRDCKAALTYRFEGDLATGAPSVSLDATVAPDLNGRVAVKLSTDGKTWPVTAGTQETGRLELSAEGEADFASVNRFWVRVTMSGEPGDAPPCGIDNLRIHAAIQPPARPVVRLKPITRNGPVAYEETFETRRYRLTGTCSGDEQLEWTRGQVGVRLRPGGSDTSITWRVVSARPVGTVVVEAIGRANSGSLGTNHYLDVSADGETWANTASSVGRDTDANGWVREPLVVDLSDEPEFAGVTEFYARLRMTAQGHAEVHRVLSGVVTSVKISAQPIEDTQDTGSASPMQPDEKLVYKTTAEGDLELHIFKPEGHEPTDKRPAIVFFFGGGWVNGSPAQFYAHSRYLASRGMVAIGAEYRIESAHGTTPFDCVRDGKSAVRWIREHAEELGIDPGKLAAGGGSAGGHVAGATAFLPGLEEPDEDKATSARPDALVLFNPVIDNGPGGFGYNRVGDRYREISPLHNIGDDPTPTTFFLGTEDKLIPVSTGEKFKSLIEEAGGRCDLHVYDGQAHGFFNYGNGKNEHYTLTVLEMDRFLASLGFLAGEPTLTMPAGDEE